MKVTDIVFNCVDSLNCKCHKINLVCGRLYIGCNEWIKTKNSRKYNINYYDNTTEVLCKLVKDKFIIFGITRFY